MNSSLVFARLSPQYYRSCGQVCATHIQIQFLKLRLESMNGSNDVETEREAQPNRSRKQLSNEQRAVIVQALLERSTNKILKRGAINKVARQFDVNRAAIRRVWSREIASLTDGNILMDGSSKKSNCGRKKKNLQQQISSISDIPLR